MNTKTLLVAALCLTTSALSAAASPHLGTWKLNESKSKLPPDGGKNTTVTYAAEGDKIQVTVDGVDKDGKATHSVWTGQFDGKFYPVKGNLTYDQVMYKMVNDRTNDITAMKDGKVAWSGTIKVAEDGKSRVVMIQGTDADGKKFKARAFYDKA